MHHSLLVKPMPDNTDAHVTSRYSVSNEQLIPQFSKFISISESSRNKIPVLHFCRQTVEAITFVTSANTFCENYHEDGRATNDRNRDDKGEKINSNRYATIEGCYSSETDDVHNVANGNDSSYDNDVGSMDPKQEWNRINICNNERRRQRIKLAEFRKKQWSRKRDIINQFIGSFILFVSTMQVTLACPEIITSVCRCDDSQNGIILKCSHTNGAQVVHTLKANQINLGLIQHLEMQNSGLEHIPPGFFSGLFIKKLDLSYNSILDIDENSFLGMNDVLQELILHHNNLTQLPSKALTPLSALLRLDLSNNSIGDIEAEHAFPPLLKLFDINLANNRICQIHKNAFDDVKHSIQMINLGRNCLERVPAPAIRGLKQLVALHLHNNHINSLEALSFMNLPLMNLLNLASNQISTIHNRTFLNVPNLRYLYLTRNRITDISPHQFSSFEQLEMLDLTGNHLTELRENSFSNLKNLRQLYLGENLIRKIKPDGFANSSMVILILNSNRLSELQKGMFHGLTKLQQLALKNNQIQSIDQNSFDSNPNLAMLDLSNNILVDIPPLTFMAQVNLFLIDLSGNKLERIPYQAFNRDVKIVLLQENPLVCSEGVHMLQHGVGIYISSSKDIICGPKEYPNPNRIGNATDFTSIPSNSTDFMVDGSEDSNFKQGEKPPLPKILPVIRPLSSIDNEANKADASVGEQEKIGVNEVNLVRPINSAVNTKPNLFLKSPEMFNNKQLVDDARGRTSTISESRISDTRNYENKMMEDTEIINRNTSENGQRSFDNNNIIHPFPVPFLKRRSKLSKASMVIPRTTTTIDPTFANDRTSSEQTLPPSIVVANNVQELDYTTLAHKIEKNFVENSREAQASGEQIFLDVDNTERLERVTTPSVIILICLSTVAIVMAAVLIGLCVTKHRRLQIYHGSMTTNSVTRTNAYVDAQHDMIYGTVRRNRNVPMLNRFDDGQPWIYAPTSYGTSVYYK